LRFGSIAPLTTQIILTVSKNKIMKPNIENVITLAPGIMIHLCEEAAWIFNSKTLTIVDGNNAALKFCQYAKHAFIGLRITELWHGHDLDKILDDIHVSKYESSFFGSVRHRKSNGEIVMMRLRATRVKGSEEEWEVHLAPKRGGY
jgi:hypothetical protein